MPSRELSEFGTLTDSFGNLVAEHLQERGIDVLDQRLGSVAADVEYRYCIVSRLQCRVQLGELPLGSFALAVVHDVNETTAATVVLLCYLRHFS